MKHALVVIVASVLCVFTFAAGYAVGQSSAPPPLTLEQHNKLFTNLNTDKNLYIRQEALQKKFSDGCNAALSADPEYKEITSQKNEVDTEIKKEVEEVTKGVDPKKWLLSLDSGQWEKPKTEQR
jgi:hypothetical protein